jgi:hypothetical protein
MTDTSDKNGGLMGYEELGGGSGQTAKEDWSET